MAEKIKSMSEADGNLPISKHIQFRYQLSEKYRGFVQEGLIKELETADLCWLAGIDMALSAYTYDDTKRMNVVSEILRRAKQANAIENNGLLIQERHQDALVRDINTLTQAASIPMQTSAVVLPSGIELIHSLQDGAFVQLGLITPTGGAHAVLFDEVYFNRDQSKVILGYWDSAMPHPDLGRRFANDHSANPYLPFHTPSKHAIAFHRTG